MKNKKRIIIIVSIAACRNRVQHSRLNIAILNRNFQTLRTPFRPARRPHSRILICSFLAPEMVRVLVCHNIIIMIDKNRSNTIDLFLAITGTSISSGTVTKNIDIEIDLLILHTRIHLGTCYSRRNHKHSHANKHCNNFLHFCISFL